MLTHLLLLPGLYFVFADMDRLGVHAEPAVAVLPLQEDGRNLVRLPGIEFHLRLAPHCAYSGTPESLSITIADTRRTLRGEELRAAHAIDAAVLIPASQLAPFALQGFCVDPASEGDSTMISAALAAQASLRCGRDNGSSVVFTAESLDIRVDCVRSATEAASD